MGYNFRRAISVSAACLALVMSSTAFAAEFEMKISSGHPLDPDASPTAASIRVFKRQAELYTHGRLQVEIFPSGQLGDALPSLRQVRSGEIEAAEVFVGILGNMYPPFSFSSLPYIVPDGVSAADLYSRRNPFMLNMIKGLEDAMGLGISHFQPQSFRHLTTTKTPVQTAADMKGLKIRTMEVPVHIEMFNAAGALATPVPWLELYTSLQTGVVDGEENPLSSIRQASLYEVQKHITYTGHVLNAGAMVYNLDWFNKLPKDIQLAILKAGEEAAAASLAYATVADIVNVEYFEANGVDFYRPTAEELNTFRSSMRPAAFKWFSDNVENGDQILAELEAEFERLRDTNEALLSPKD